MGTQPRPLPAASPQALLTQKRSQRTRSQPVGVGYLVSCPYCVFHYAAFTLVPLTGTYAIDVAVGGWPGMVLSWFLSSLLVTVIAAFFRVMFWFVDETQGLVRRRQRKEEEEEIATKCLMRKRVEQKVSTSERSAPPSPDSH